MMFFLKIFAVLVIILGFFLVGIGWKIILKNQEFRKTAIKTTGTIIELKVMNTRNKGKAYGPVIAFQTADGKNITYQSETYYKAGQHQVGEAIEILYSKEDPSQALQSDGYAFWQGPLFILCIGLVFIGAGLFFILRNK